MSYGGYLAVFSVFIACPSISNRWSNPMPERHKGARSNVVFIATSSLEQHGYDHVEHRTRHPTQTPNGHLDTQDVVFAVWASRPLASGEIHPPGGLMRRVRRLTAGGVAARDQSPRPSSRSGRSRGS